MKELTGRQRAVLDARVNGESYKAIAKRLGISERTARVHLHDALSALGVYGRGRFVRGRRRWLDMLADTALRAATD